MVGISNIFFRLTFLALAALFLSCANTWAVTETNGQEISFDIENYALSLDVENAPLIEVIKKIGTLADFETTLIAKLPETPIVNASFDKIPLTTALDNILMNLNYVVYFASSEESPKNKIVSHLWILGTRNESPALVLQPVADLNQSDPLDSANSKTRSEAALRLPNLTHSDNSEEVLNKLVSMLEADQDPLVRTRAAIALGTLQNPDAIDALVVALQDPHASVRLQAIGALGQISSERSVNALGKLLISDSSPTTERVVAAQALWKQNSERASDFLKIGANSENRQVSRASSSPPVVPKRRDKVKAGKEQFE